MRTEPLQQTSRFIVNAMFLTTQKYRQFSSIEESPSLELLCIESTRHLVPSPWTSGFTKVHEGIIDNSVKFEQLRLSWLVERGATSLITEIAMCPSYHRIIAMGPPVIPLILRQVENEGDEPDMWFWALHVLTGANPITESQRGDLLQMAMAWLNWARDRYVW